MTKCLSPWCLGTFAVRYAACVLAEGELWDGVLIFYEAMWKGKVKRVRNRNRKVKGKWKAKWIRTERRTGQKWKLRKIQENGVAEEKGNTSERKSGLKDCVRTVFDMGWKILCDSV